MLHINDRARAEHYLRVLDPVGPDPDSFDEELRSYARMLVLSFWANQPQNLLPAGFADAVNLLRRFLPCAKNYARLWNTALVLPALFRRLLG